MTTDNLPERIEWVDAEVVDDLKPPKPVCWWRLGPNVRNPNLGASDREVIVTVNDDTVTLILDDHATTPNVESWRIGITSDTPDGKHHDYVDLLCFEPPMLPRPIDWQRISRWNDRAHPGDNMDNWRWDFDGPEAYRD